MRARYLACALALIAPLLLITACKSSGGSSVGEFITILRTGPAERAENVNVSVRIGFQVSDNARIDPATFNERTLIVTDENGNVITGTYAVCSFIDDGVCDEDDGPDVAVMVPDEPLDVITRYDAVITTGLVASGASLEEDFEWFFVTLDSSWGESEWLESVGTGNLSRQQVAVDGQLNAFAVWEYEESTGTSIWANRYTRVDLWDTPTPLETVFASSRPALAADDAGNAFVVWQRSEDIQTPNIWSSRYDVIAATWTAPELIQTGNIITAARLPKVAADPAGNAIAVWLEQATDTGREQMTSSRYTPGSGWGEAEVIEAPPTTALAGSVTAVGADDDGNAIAVWDRNTVNGQVLWSNRYAAGLGWGTAELIKTDTQTDARNFRLSVGANGDAFVIWLQNEGERDDIWATRFSGGVWSEPTRLDDVDREKRGPDVAVDGFGVAHAVWSQRDPYPEFDPQDGILNIYAAQYTPGTGWGSPALIEQPRRDDMGELDPNEDDDAEFARISVNAAGNAFVVWRQRWLGWRSIWSNRLDPDTGWFGEEVIEDEERTAKTPVIAVDDDRHAHAVWLHGVSSAVDWVRTNRFE